MSYSDIAYISIYLTWCLGALSCFKFKYDFTAILLVSLATNGNNLEIELCSHWIFICYPGITPAVRNSHLGRCCPISWWIQVSRNWIFLKWNTVYIDSKPRKGRNDCWFCSSLFPHHLVFGTWERFNKY